MAEIASIRFKGHSGKSYKFETYSKDHDTFEDVSAVYVFVRRYKNAEKYYQRALYVGETGELKTRLANHEKWSDVEELGCTAISVMLVNGEKERKVIETDLIKAKKPPCNIEKIPNLHFLD